jgi:hypothetical protein
MPWSKLDDRLHENPKVGALSDKAFRLYILSITYSSSRKSRGKLSVIDAKTVRRLAEATEETISELVELRAWDRVDDGYEIHDYGVYNPSEEEISQKRADAGRKGAQSRWQNGKPIASAITNECQTDIKGSPVPVPESRTRTRKTPPVVTDSKESENVASTAQNGRAVSQSKAPSCGKLVWNAYSAAYKTRYGVEPTANAQVYTIIKRFVTLVPQAEAPDIAAFYVSHNGQFYIGCRHDVKKLVTDYQKLRTDWQTGRMGTQHEAREGDRLTGVAMDAMAIARDRTLAKQTLTLVTTDAKEISA